MILNKNSKSKMFILVLSMSTVIFILSYSAFFLSNESKDKDIPYFSDNYLIIQLNPNINTNVNTNVNIEDFLNSIKGLPYKHIAFSSEIGSYRVVDFTKDFFNEIGISSKQGNKAFHTQGNFAFVNKSNQNECYSQNDLTMINIYGKSYQVVGFFRDNNRDLEYQTTAYINVNSENMKDNNLYTYIFLDVTHQNPSLTESALKKLYPNAHISKWNGKQHGLIYTNDIYFYFVLLCGVILCMNCISFAYIWIKSYKKELAIRRIVGSTKKANHIFILREYMKIIVRSSLYGIVASYILYLIFYQVESLGSIRNIFGYELQIKNILLAILSTLIITFIIIEIEYYRLRKESIKKGVDN